MVCEDCEAAACYIDGLPEMPIGSVTVEDVSFNYSKDAKPSKPAMREFMEEFLRVGMYFDNVKDLTVRRVKVEGASTEALIANHVGALHEEENSF